MEETQAQGGMDPVSAIANAVGSIFTGAVDLIQGSPRRIAKQREAARADSLAPGMFRQTVSNTPIFVALGVFGLLILAIIIFSTKGK